MLRSVRFERRFMSIMMSVESSPINSWGHNIYITTHYAWEEDTGEFQ